MLLDGKFGKSGSEIVVEEFMTGPEVTVLAFTDGKTSKAYDKLYGSQACL